MTYNGEQITTDLF